MEISLDAVKLLREKTGSGVVDCKNALAETKGDIDKAIESLRKKGLASALKKAGRIAVDGLIVSYIHTGGKLGVLVEVNCETDFVARTDDFKELVKDISMHIAGIGPLYITKEEVPKKVLEKEKEIYREEALKAGKPEKIVDKIAEGKLEKYYSLVCLMEQPFVRDPNIKVKDRISQAIAKLGENIVVRRFARFKLGEEVG